MTRKKKSKLASPKKSQHKPLTFLSPKISRKKENILQASTLNKQYKYHISTLISEIGIYENKNIHNKDKKKDMSLNAM